MDQKSLLISYVQNYECEQTCYKEKGNGNIVAPKQSRKKTFFRWMLRKTLLIAAKGIDYLGEFSH